MDHSAKQRREVNDVHNFDDPLFHGFGGCSFDDFIFYAEFGNFDGFKKHVALNTIYSFGRRKFGNFSKEACQNGTSV